MNYYVYLMTNQSNMVLYAGVTNDITRRVYEHKTELSGFCGKYNLNKLVYVETTNNIKDAIAREKQIKRWARKKKEDLIKTINPEWRDLSEE